MKHIALISPWLALGLNDSNQVVVETKNDETGAVGRVALTADETEELIAALRTKQLEQAEAGTTSDWVCGDCGDDLFKGSGGRFYHRNDRTPQCRNRDDAAKRKPGFFAGY